MKSPRRAPKWIFAVLAVSLIAAGFYARDLQKKYSLHFRQQVIRLLESSTQLDVEIQTFRPSGFFAFRITGLKLKDGPTQKIVLEVGQVTGRLSRKDWLAGRYAVQEMDWERCDWFLEKFNQADWNSAFLYALVPSAREAREKKYNLKMPDNGEWLFGLEHLSVSNLIIHYSVFKPRFRTTLSVPLLVWTKLEHPDLSDVRAVLELPFFNSPASLQGVFSRSLNELKFKLDSRGKVSFEGQLSIGDLPKLDGKLHLSALSWSAPSLALPSWGPWQGTVTGDFDLGVEGVEPAAWSRSLGVRGALDIRDGVLTAFNTYKQALPAELIKEYLKRPHGSSWDGFLRQDSTDFERFEAKINFMNGSLELENAFIKSPHAMANLFITYNVFEHHLEFASKLILLEDWTKHLVAENPDWTKYKNETGRLVFENIYRGLVSNG